MGAGRGGSLVLALVVASAAGAAVVGCGGGGGSSGGGAPAPTGGSTTPTGGTTTPTGGTTTPTGGTTTPTGQVGSRFWYVGDAFGNPFKTHDTAEAQLAGEVLTLVNQQRAANGLPALSLDLEAERAAKVHAEDMVGRAYFSHITPDGWSPSDRLTMTGAAGFSTVGENIANGYPTAAAVMTGWMNSSGHRANILGASYTHIGVGVDATGPHWVQVFLRR